MKFSVRDYRRVERADIEGDHIIVVAGRNNQGKTSTLQGVALAATGEGLPPSVKKKDAAELVRWGCKEAKVKGAFGEGEVSLDLPKADVVTQGKLQFITPIAAMMDSICFMTPEEAAQELAQLIQCEPSREDLKAACDDQGMAAAIQEKVWAKIQSDGWDVAFAQAKETGVKAKGRWEGITGAKRWGEKLAASWRPDGWCDDLEYADLDALIQVERERESALEAAIASVAVDENKVQELRELAGDLDEEKQAREDALKKVEEIEGKLSEAKKERNDIGDLPPDTPLSCPHCGGLLKMHRESQGVHTLTALQDSDVLSDKDRKALRSNIATLDGRITNLGNELNKWKGIANDKMRTITRCETAKQELDEISQRSAGNTTADQVQAARDALSFAQADVRMKTSLIEARKTNAIIMSNIALQQILGPDGLRKTVLGRAISQFVEEQIKPVCEAAGWPQVTIEPDMTIRAGGASYRNMGDSWRMLTRTVVQVAMARARGDAFVIIDGADMLDPGNRNKMFKMLSVLKVKAIVGMTIFEPKLIAGLVKAPTVSPFWINEGISKPLADMLE